LTGKTSADNPFPRRQILRVDFRDVSELNAVRKTLRVQFLTPWLDVAAIMIFKFHPSPVRAQGETSDAVEEVKIIQFLISRALLPRLFASLDRQAFKPFENQHVRESQPRP
jgi:hypothetical protein